MKNTLLAILSFSISMTTNAFAAPKNMPIDFIGEWCTPSKDGDITTYTLPSWTEDHKCNEILSIDQWEFVFNMGGDVETYCNPESIRTKQDVAPSGVAYFATISANCREGLNPNRKSHRTYEFKRYKGNLMIRSK
ncbi:hypothetical protein ACQR1E_01945 [Bradyrhizobium sp. HKCCYLRH1030]